MKKFFSDIMIGLFGNPTKKEPEFKCFDEFISNFRNFDPSLITEQKPKIVWLKTKEGYWVEVEMVPTFLKYNGEIYPGKTNFNYTGRIRDYDPTKEVDFEF
ncbi:hypothetical protein AVV36_gp024 [Pectobacterium bacteriophage PM2]|uniref:Uncharacterized protein n=1 Tax=Pectobacterium bacteriophage PM2 TaxID=1429794 RepID=A0A0A0Q0A0_9CAUD|nr:hypothetical protein AVV36_gp024 [Pectobacterium bacteriophage PM2]AHY24986.1 hypothetical protein PM2_024 [Pectobacterium bacteriophage PM2]